MKGDAIDAADTTNMDTIAEKHSSRTLFAHGNAVGLNDGLMGNSEVGCVQHQVHFRYAGSLNSDS
jgi:2,3-bisphosphoglycerate-independent phosphoglycerate mutase